MPEFTDAELDELKKAEREAAKEEARAEMTAEREQSEQWTRIYQIEETAQETAASVRLLLERLPEPARETTPDPAQADPQEVKPEGETGPVLVEVEPEPEPKRKEKPRHHIW